MDAGTIITVAAAIATAIGGYFGGRKAAASTALSMAQNTVNLLESQVNVMQAREVEKEEVIKGLMRRIEILEDMALQREDLTQLKLDVREIKEMVGA
jgi:hypothetical protein